MAPTHQFRSQATLTFPSPLGQIPHDDPKGDAAFVEARLREALMWDLPFGGEDDNGAGEMGLGMDMDGEWGREGEGVDRWNGAWGEGEGEEKEEEQEEEDWSEYDYEYEFEVPFAPSEQQHESDRDQDETSGSDGSEFDATAHAGLNDMLVGGGLDILDLLAQLPSFWVAMGAVSASASVPATVDDLIDCLEGLGPGSRQRDGDDNECPICHEEIGSEARAIMHDTCGNTFCESCVLEWVEENRRSGRTTTCPTCRRVIVDAPNVVVEEEEDEEEDEEDEDDEDEDEYESEDEDQYEDEVEHEHGSEHEHEAITSNSILSLSRPTLPTTATTTADRIYNWPYLLRLTSSDSTPPTRPLSPAERARASILVSRTLEQHREWLVRSAVLLRDRGYAPEILAGLLIPASRGEGISSEAWWKLYSMLLREANGRVGEGVESCGVWYPQALYAEVKGEMPGRAEWGLRTVDLGMGE